MALNIGDIVILICVAILLYLCANSLIKAKKAGVPSCACGKGCAHCSMACAHKLKTN